MSFGDIVGQLLQQGLGGQTQQRVERTLGPQGLGAGGGLDQILGSLLGGARGGSAGGAGGGLGGLLDMASQMLGGSAGGGLSRGQLGGLGALAGVLLGGRDNSMAKNALGGTAMALLGSMALKALQARMNGGANTPRAGFADIPVTDSQVTAATDEKAQELVLRAMLNAAKADGQISQDEIQRIIGKIDDDGITPAERQLVMEELRRPLDMAGLVAAVPNELVAAEVYAASLLAIDVDTPQEVAYLRDLAAALKLDVGTISRLHDMTGVAAMC